MGNINIKGNNVSIINNKIFIIFVYIIYEL